MDLLQTTVHYGLHGLLPGLAAYILFRGSWKIAWLLMLTTMLVDLDHLLAEPVFDPTRCSIGFHPLHTYVAMVLYGLLLLVKNLYVRVVAVGLLIHMVVDWQDCIWM